MCREEMVGVRPGKIAFFFLQPANALPARPACLPVLEVTVQNSSYSHCQMRVNVEARNVCPCLDSPGP